MLNHCTQGSLSIILRVGGAGGGEGGILKQYLGFGEPLCVRKPDPVLDKKFLKYKPGLGQHPKFYFPV